MLKIQPVLPTRPVAELNKMKQEAGLQKQPQDKYKPVPQERDSLPLQYDDKAVR